MKHLLLIVALFSATNCIGQNETNCITVSSLKINTGYDYKSNQLIPLLARDSAWKYTYATPLVATYLGNIAMNSPSVICSTQTQWITSPSSGWVSINDMGMLSLPSTASPIDYGYGITRQFKVCTKDSFRFEFQIASDDYVGAIALDGDTIYSQPVNNPMSSFQMFNVVPTFTKVLQPGIHNVFIKIFNYPSSFVSDNPTAINFQGTITSIKGNLSIVSNNSPLNCPCTPSSIGAIKSNSDITITPNPATDEIVINTGRNFVGKDVRFLDMMGRLVKTVRIMQERQTVAVNELPEGTYGVVISETENAVIKFTKL